MTRGGRSDEGREDMKREGKPKLFQLNSCNLFLTELACIYADILEVPRS